jgi:hypothetical protein
VNASRETTGSHFPDFNLTTAACVIGTEFAPDFRRSSG